MPKKYTKIYICWDDVPLVMTVSELCIILGIIQPTASKMLNDGVIEATFVGNKWFIPKENVKKFLKVA